MNVETGRLGRTGDGVEALQEVLHLLGADGLSFQEKDTSLGD